MHLGLLHLAGAALNVIGTGLIFVFAYPPKEESRRGAYLSVNRVALVLVFFGFLMQLLAAIVAEINPPVGQ
jgi:hypothetical protein